MRGGCLRLCMKLHSCEWQAFALLHKAPFTRVEGTCACTQSSTCASRWCLCSQMKLHLCGASCASIFCSCKWSFTRKHKRPPLKHPLLARVELSVQARGPTACLSGALCVLAHHSCNWSFMHMHLPIAHTS